MTLEKAFNLWIEAVSVEYIFGIFAVLNIIAIVVVFIKRFYPVK